MNGKKVWKKTGFGVLFVAACFAAMYILMAFYGNVLMVALAAVVLLATAFLFLNEIFSDKSKKWMQGAEGSEFSNESLSVGTEGEFRLKIVKHMKETESTQKELLNVLKNQNVLLQNRMENMEQAIITLSENQVNQTKSVIKFNKENARQLAISERETLEYVMIELKQAIKDNAGAVGVRAASAEVETEAVPVPEVPVIAEPLATPIMELEELGEEELFEVSDLVSDEEYVIPETPIMEEPEIEEVPAEEPIAEEPTMEENVEEEFEIPDMPDDIDLSALFEDMAAGALEEAGADPLADIPDIPMLEDIPLPEEIVPEEEPAEVAPEADPLAGLSGDPNAMMTPEDIAKLLASMGQ